MDLKFSKNQLIIKENQVAMKRKELLISTQFKKIKKVILKVRLRQKLLMIIKQKMFNFNNHNNNNPIISRAQEKADQLKDMFSFQKIPRV